MKKEVFFQEWKKMQKKLKKELKNSELSPVYSLDSQYLRLSFTPRYGSEEHGYVDVYNERRKETYKNYKKEFFTEILKELKKIDEKIGKLNYRFTEKEEKEIKEFSNDLEDQHWMRDLILKRKIN